MKLTLMMLLLTACGDKERGEDVLSTLYCNGDVDGTKISEDGDCDGVLTADDCDDGDTSLMAIAEDGDCDGVLTADDCDDEDSANVWQISTDGDCDGVLTADDCDDGDASLMAIVEDGDCDGVLTVDDCDDGDSDNLWLLSEDADCDGVITADDCDDNDPSSTIIAEDADCDGVITAEDCDDNDPISTIIADDMDCDGTLAIDDCDDQNEYINPYAEEVVDDGVDQDCSGADLSCDNTTEIVWFADFPSTGTGSCDWGNNGNLPDEQGKITARREQEAVYMMASGSAICAVRPAFQSNQGGYQTTFNFDDEVMLVYNDYVLFSTNESLVAPLQSGNWQGKLYDWDLMKGADLSGWTWEWGNSFASVGLGQFDLSMEDNKMNNLADISLVNGEVRMMLVTFGDDDNQGDSDGADCFHEGLSIPVVIELAQ